MHSGSNFSWLSSAGQWITCPNGQSQDWWSIMQGWKYQTWTRQKRVTRSRHVRSPGTSSKLYGAASSSVLGNTHNYWFMSGSISSDRKARRRNNIYLLLQEYYHWRKETASTAKVLCGSGFTLRFPQWTERSLGLSMEGLHITYKWHRDPILAPPLWRIWGQI